MPWRDLATDPPTGNEHCVLLFPCRSDVGIFYITSNPYYAMQHGVEQGYTHWAEIELAPTHDEMVRWQDEINQKNSW